MTTIVIFALEGVLQSGSGRPVDAGCRLYRTLHSTLGHQLILATTGTEGDARRFLDSQHLPVPAHISANTGAYRWDWTAGCQMLRRMYPYDIDYVIVPDPDIAAALYYEGFRTLLWTDPRYARPEWRPDHPVSGEGTSWARLAADLAADRDRAAADNRISPR